jgi:hypothetical protein
MAFSTSPFERRSRTSGAVIGSYDTLLNAAKRTGSAALRHPVQQRGFQMALIFNGLQPSKMAARPCTACSLPKNQSFSAAC